MKQCFALLFLWIYGQLPAAAQFGSFASAVYMSTDNGLTKNWYNTQKLTGDVNAIGSQNFGGNMGSFASLSGGLQLNGGEIKSFRGSADNVCGGKLYYRVYTAGNADGPFTLLSLPFFANCSAGVFTDGKGPCSPTDQKWQAVNASIDLTNRAAGNYTLELYFEVSGKINSTDGCDQIAFDSDFGNNYKANFTITQPLPVKLLHFSGLQKNKDILLQWATATEENNQQFVVLHSTTGQHFEAIGTVAGHGNSAIARAYQFSHVAPIGLRHFYRLKQVDKNGNSHFSGVITIDASSVSRLSLFPNPTKEWLQISGLETGELVWLIDVAGRVLKQLKAAGTTLSLPVQWLAPGTYFMRVGQNGQQQKLTFVKE